VYTSKLKGVKSVALNVMIGKTYLTEIEKAYEMDNILGKQERM